MIIKGGRKDTGLVQVGDGAYANISGYFGGAAGGPHSGFLVVGDSLLIIDSMQTPAMVEEFQSRISQVTDKKPTFLINSHHHGDHISGNKFFSPPAEVIAHEYVRQWMLEDTASNGTEWHMPSITFNDRMTLHLDGEEVQLFYYGKAHTPGDALIYIPAQKLLYAVDVAVTGMVPFMADGHAGSWINVLRCVEGLEIDTLVPGHGYIGSKDDVTSLREYLEELHKAVSECFNNGATEDQAIEQISISKGKDWNGQPTVPMAIKRVYAELRGELD